MLSPHMPSRLIGGAGRTGRQRIRAAGASRRRLKLREIDDLERRVLQPRGKH